ncbi:hypothetical protein MC378_11550 [Polaribacter sp. MSW13]|uniref:DUF4296 domain-containing protein n=1 Tax=Polaribacter marinus TaxID=2916838 RepID=A0A9X1VPF9_9FLAO|nr:hypothetical protein [Polaribacter marinus]MCI2229803.1 hypothetical protein [Polaribacter marinus]
MKKATLLLTLILIATIGFSQNKIGGNDSIKGIDIIIRKNPASRPLPNPGNDPLIDQINKLELEYLNLKAIEIQNSFAKQDLSKLKTQEEVFKAYVKYLSKLKKQKGIEGVIEILEKKKERVRQGIPVKEKKNKKN